jgi:hypothetical protein
MKMILSKGTHTVGIQINNEVSPVKKIGEINIDNALNKIKDLAHPYLIYNENDVAGILTNISSKEPLKTLYNKLNKSVSSFTNRNDKFEQTWTSKGIISGLIIRFLNGSTDALDDLKLLLKNIDEFPYQHRSTQDSARFGPAPALVYDAIYNNLTTNERTEYAQNLKDFITPLANTMDITPMNNHLGDRLGAVGLIALALKDPYLLKKALESTTIFLNYETVDGIPIESFGYAHWGYKECMPYLYSLKKLDIINLFQVDSPMDRFFSRTLGMTSPAGIWPHYEDEGDGPDQAYHLRLYSHLTDNLALRENIAYINEIQNRSKYVTNNFVNKHYEFWELYVWKDPATPSPPANHSFSWITYEGGNSALRTDWSENAVYLTMNAKTYHQSHTHLDELSYEIHAYGAWLVTNVGYPGWKGETHAFCVSTMGSNTIRLNHQDQLQETCDGFSLYAFSKETDMVKMNGGNLYRSPYHILQNPIYYIITISLQLVLVGFSAYMNNIFQNKGTNGKGNKSNKYRMKEIANTKKTKKEKGGKEKL